MITYLMYAVVCSLQFGCMIFQLGEFYNEQECKDKLEEAEEIVMTLTLDEFPDSAPGVVAVCTKMEGPPA